MPDDTSALSEEQQEKFVEWLKSKGPHPLGECSVCGTNSWTIGTHLLSGTIVSDAGVSVLDQHYPMAYIVCNNCAHVRQFMAVPIGLVDQNPPEGSTDG